MINTILQEITEDQIKKEVSAVQKVELPKSLVDWVNRYKEFGNRKDFIWQWLFRMFDVVQIPGVDKEYREQLREVKFLTVMFVVLLDDVADSAKDKEFLDQLSLIPINLNIQQDGLTDEKRGYYVFAQQLWHEIFLRLQPFPRHQELKEILDFDVRQIVNAMNFSYIVNNHIEIINKFEFWSHNSYNMGFFVYSLYDLMCSTNFDISKLGILREVVGISQKMTRIGNWVSTWEREVPERDFTSGIFAYAIQMNVLTVKDLQGLPAEKIIEVVRTGGVETELLNEWDCLYRELKRYTMKDAGIDVEDFLNRLSQLLVMHLSSRSYK